MLSYDEIRKGFEEVDKKFEEREKKYAEMRRQEMERRGITPFESRGSDKPHFDHPNTMENSTATFFWVVAMVVGALFKGGWLIWTVVTLIWIKFITRHNK